MSGVLLEALGDCAVLIRFGTRIDAQLNQHVHRAAAALRVADLPGIANIVPAYASIAVHYDPCAWAAPGDTAGAYARLATRLSEFVDNARFVDNDTGSAAVEIPVCYGADFGPDLEHLAHQAGLHADAVIARHCAPEYRVAMLGFAPGFPYLLGLDPALRVPRRTSPRTRVPAGSVAIGGAQAGIYPRELPGGWQIIGRTPLRLFDPARAPPALLAPGQRLRFRAVDAGEFAQLSA